jgi:hypothetical protein
VSLPLLLDQQHALFPLPLTAQLYSMPCCTTWLKSAVLHWPDHGVLSTM